MGEDDRNQKRAIEGTWDPNENALWPIFPRGTRLPIRKLRPWQHVLGGLLALTWIGGTIFVVVWLVGYTHRN